ncbi:hypothetical protein DASC09_015270 [Saccharomycopsis crataegensis]|uniref:Uncharacterized protein n=1 Tax=Saccharomycopsis crataegensis TaxID=43959 RepID=A0AAV5QHY2_9ASCO|nr:hypothetical protein DASC09_015270 [Saccharomycopsis crataegensis]
MVRGTKVDIPNPFKNNEYKPIFLSSTEPSNVVEQNELNKRISEIEKNLEAVESILNDSRSVIVNENGEAHHGLSRSRSFSSQHNGQEDMRSKIIELKHRLSSQKSISDLRSESDLSGYGKLRHYRSTSIISDRVDRQSKYGGSDYNDYVYSQSRYGSGNYSESNLDLISLPGFKYEYTQKDQELKSNINALRDRLIRKRISDTALSLKAHPYLSSLNSRSSNRISPEPEQATLRSSKRLSIIEDSYEKLTGSSSNKRDIQSPESQRQTEELKKGPRRSLSYGYLRYSQYTNKSTNALSPTKEVISPQKSVFSDATENTAKSVTSNNNNTTKSDISSNTRVLRMVKSIESMNGSQNYNSKLVDKEKLAKLNEVRDVSERRVESLRKRLTADGFGAIDDATSQSYSAFKAQRQNQKHKSSPVVFKNPKAMDDELVSKQADVKNKIQDLKQQVSNRQSDRLSKTSSQILDPMAPRAPSRTSQYLKSLHQNSFGEEEEEEVQQAQQAENTIPENQQDESDENLIATKDTEKSFEGEQDGNMYNNFGKEASMEEFVEDSPLSSTVDASKNASSAINTPHTSVTQTTGINNSDSDQTPRARNSICSRYSISHEYAYTKPDLNTVAQNLTYRRSAFADTMDDDDDDDVMSGNQLEATIDEDAFKSENMGNDGGSGYQNLRISIDNDTLFDLPHAAGANPTEGLGRRLSVKGYKSHGKSHSISSNISAMERGSNVNEKRASQYGDQRGSASTGGTPVIHKQIDDSDIISSYSVEARDIFTAASANKTMAPSDKSDLRHKLSTKRSFNVLKQSIVESNYGEAAVSSPGATKPSRNVQHKVTRKKQKQKSGFLRRLASLFKRG